MQTEAGMALQLVTAGLSVYSTAPTWPVLLSLGFNNLEHEVIHICYKFISSVTKEARYF